MNDKNNTNDVNDHGVCDVMISEVTYESLDGSPRTSQKKKAALKRNVLLGNADNNTDVGAVSGVDVLATVVERSKEFLSVYDSGSSVDDDQDFASMPDQQQPQAQERRERDRTNSNVDKNVDGGVTPPSTADAYADSNDKTTTNDRRDEFATSTLPTESQTSFRMEWTVEQMNSNFAQQSWYRETRDWVNNMRYRCGMIVNNKHVQTLIVVMISINAIMMGLATFDFVKKDPVLSHRFEVVDQVFLIIFTVELGMQFIYHGFRLLLDGWLVFDLVIILVSWSFSQIQIVRAFRIFRALRLVTRIKIMKNLILALFGVMPRMAAIGLMLALIFYIFGVMFTQLFKDLDNTSYNYFGSLGWTFFTLFQMMTLDDWASICREVILVYKWAWLPFILFVIVSGFIVVNLIIAVICDAIGALHTGEKAKLHGDYDDDVSDESDSQPIDIREQLDTLEDQMEDLTRIQARTYHTLQYLTRQIQMHKVKQELQSKTTGQNFTDAIKKLKSVRRASQRLITPTDLGVGGNNSGVQIEDATTNTGAIITNDTNSNNSVDAPEYVHQQPRDSNRQRSQDAAAAATTANRRNSFEEGSSGLSLSSTETMDA